MLYCRAEGAHNRIFFMGYRVSCPEILEKFDFWLFLLFFQDFCLFVKGLLPEAKQILKICVAFRLEKSGANLHIQGAA